MEMFRGKEELKMTWALIYSSAFEAISDYILDTWKN